MASKGDISSKPLRSAKLMISYQWDSKKRALEIREKLCEAGHTVWMDDKNMSKFLFNFTEFIEEIFITKNAHKELKIGINIYSQIHMKLKETFFQRVFKYTKKITNKYHYSWLFSITQVVEICKVEI